MAGDAESVNRLGVPDRLCETLVSWRLLVGGLSPGASHHSFTKSSEEPPLSNFNSQWDIPSWIDDDQALEMCKRSFHKSPRRGLKIAEVEVYFRPQPSKPSQPDDNATQTVNVSVTDSLLVFFEKTPYRILRTFRKRSTIPCFKISNR